MGRSILLLYPCGNFQSAFDVDEVVHQYWKFFLVSAKTMDNWHRYFMWYTSIGRWLQSITDLKCLYIAQLWIPAIIPYVPGTDRIMHIATRINTHVTFILSSTSNDWKWNVFRKSSRAWPLSRKMGWFPTTNGIRKETVFIITSSQLKDFWCDSSRFKYTNLKAFRARGNWLHIVVRYKKTQIHMIESILFGG